jgi:hypothetical protein
MKSFARTCVLWLVLYLVLAALVGAAIYERFPEMKVAAIGGLAAGFFIWVALGYVTGVKNKGVEARQLRQAIEGSRPRDGERVAIAGVASGSVSFLESPVSRKRCLVYEYKAIPPQNESLAAWEGFALAPMTIDGRAGSVRVLAAPELEFPGEAVGSHEHQNNFREYVARTTFLQQTSVDFKRDFAHLREINTDADGRIRDDVRRLDRDDLESMTLTEKIVAPGEKVVAFGLFSSARGGLVPDEKALMRSVKIFKGEPEALLRKVSRRRPVDLLIGCGCLVPVIVAAIVGIVAVPLTAIEQLFPEKDPSWLEVRTEKKVRDAVTRTGIVADSSAPTIELDPGAARGKITMHGTTSHWETASATRRGDDIEVTLTGDAEALTARFHPDGTLAAVDVGTTTLPVSEVVAEQIDIDEYLIRGRLTYLTPKNEPSLRVAFRAMIAK